MGRCEARGEEEQAEASLRVPPDHTGAAGALDTIREGLQETA